MRKILLASTALVAVAGMSAASAENTFGGTDVSYTSVSDDGTDNATAGENGNSWLLILTLQLLGQQQQTVVLQFCKL